MTPDEALAIVRSTLEELPADSAPTRTVVEAAEVSGTQVIMRAIRFVDDQLQDISEQGLPFNPRGVTPDRLKAFVAACAMRIRNAPAHAFTPKDVFPVELLESDVPTAQLEQTLSDPVALARALGPARMRAYARDHELAPLTDPNDLDLFARFIHGQTEVAEEIATQGSDELMAFLLPQLEEMCVSHDNLSEEQQAEDERKTILATLAPRLDGFPQARHIAARSGGDRAPRSDGDRANFPDFVTGGFVRNDIAEQTMGSTPFDWLIAGKEPAVGQFVKVQVVCPVDSTIPAALRAGAFSKARSHDATVRSGSLQPWSTGRDARRSCRGVGRRPWSATRTASIPGYFTRFRPHQSPPDGRIA